MQPVPVLLLLLAYPPFLLTLARWADIARSQARLARLAHHTAGFVVVAAWFLAGRPAIALVHAVWLLVARSWFAGGWRRPVSRPGSPGRPGPGRRR